MTQKLMDIKGDLYSKAEEFYFDEGMDTTKALTKLVIMIEQDLMIQRESAIKLGSAILQKVVKKFS